MDKYDDIMRKFRKHETHIVEPGFILNLHSRKKNPAFESHDPSMMYDPVSGFCYSYSTDAAITSQYRQGIPVRRSRDLINFEFVGHALSDNAVKEGRDNGNFPPTGGFWAPYAEYVSGEYRMYYSATKAFGSSESRIWLAVSDNPEGPFENKGVVMDTWGTDDTYPNAIDPHIINTENGKKYLVYGSYFGGIFLKELSTDTGLPLSGDIHELGIRIAHKPEGGLIDGPEGAAVIYNPETGFFYLFLSYGWLGDSYDIRVGRSRSVTGPYLDRNGRSLDGQSYGTKLAGSYCFTAENPHAYMTKDCNTAESLSDWRYGGFRGPGHGVPFFHEPTGQYFYVHHVRDGSPDLCSNGHNGDPDSYRMHYLVVRRMGFTDGWPVLSPEPYAGEPEECPVGCFDIKEGVPSFDNKQWEWICFSPDNNEMQYGSITLEIKDVSGVLWICRDFENSGNCMVFGGFAGKNVTVWGKRKGGII
ncbi:MAG: arabinan endo-1,5-alpha-L-arabinosidase [Lachnospiraceae bacterium]